MLLKLRLVQFDLAAPQRALRHGLSFLHSMRHAVESRRALAQMDARTLSDIGISAAEREAEINRKPWDIAAR
jgi:uncharacterized protein YjiS (DUF1127 family)